MTGIRQRHGRACRAKGRCKCPYEAFVYSKRDGKKIRKTFPDKAAAVACGNDASTAVRKKLLRAPTSTTLAEAAETWLTSATEGLIRTRSGDPYKPSAIRSYEAALRLRVLPALGHRKLTDVTRHDLQDLVDALLAQDDPKLEPSTIAGALLPLRAIYRRALSKGDVAVNPTTALELPRVRGGRDRIASPDEAERLLETLAPNDRPVWATALYAGLRRGELLALRIEDVDLANGVIHVRRGYDAKAGPILPKNGTGRRVPIAAVLRDYLDQHLVGLDWRDDPQALVFGVSAVSPFPVAGLGERANAHGRRLASTRSRHTSAATRSPRS